jgi:hypothetical protein
MSHSEYLPWAAPVRTAVSGSGQQADDCVRHVGDDQLVSGLAVPVPSDQAVPVDDDMAVSGAARVADHETHGQAGPGLFADVESGPTQPGDDRFGYRAVREATAAAEIRLGTAGRRG